MFLKACGSNGNIFAYTFSSDTLTGVNQVENTYFENNQAVIAGEVCGELSFSHMIYGERFFLFKLRIPRLSENFDIVNVTISERFFSDYTPEAGDFLLIEGQFRSYNNFTDTGNRLILTVFAKKVVRLDSLDEIDNPNQIYLSGYICKPPIYRTTPFQREIADILLAVNRFYNKSDYIPCIAWGRNAKFAEGLAVGTHLKLWGRVQSRDYQKRIDDENFIIKTAYEISISKMEIDQIDED